MNILSMQQLKSDVSQPLKSIGHVKKCFNLHSWIFACNGQETILYIRGPQPTYTCSGPGPEYILGHL